VTIDPVATTTTSTTETTSTSSTSTSETSTTSSTSTSETTTTSSTSETSTTETSTTTETTETSTTTATTETSTTETSTTTTSETSTTVLGTTTTSTTVPTCGAAPQTGCHLAKAKSASLRLLAGGTHLGDKVRWKWRNSATTSKASFGTPAMTSTYSMCVYDAGGLKLHVTAPAGGTCGTKTCWRETAAGFRYRSPALTPEGIQKIGLNSGAPGRATLTLVGKGIFLSLPQLPLAMPVLVQLKRSDAPDCWESTFSTFRSNDERRLKAISD
jgi:hypothetical protein